MSVNILNPGSIRIWGHGSGNEHPCRERLILTPQTWRVYQRGRTNYNWMKFWRKPKVNTSKFDSIIRKAKQNETRI